MNDITKEQEEKNIIKKLKKTLGKEYSFDFVSNKLSFRGQVCEDKSLTLGEKDALEEAFS